MKQKESNGASTVPGRTQNNGELNGVLNGKSSVFSHRFNVIAALTLLRTVILCCVPLLCFFTSVFCFHPPPPYLCKTEFHTPLYLKSSPTCLLWVFYLRQPVILCSASSWPLQALRLSHIPWTVFCLVFTMGHLDLQWQSMHLHLSLCNTLSMTSPLAT